MDATRPAPGLRSMGRFVVTEAPFDEAYRMAFLPDRRAVNIVGRAGWVASMARLALCA